MANLPELIDAFHAAKATWEARFEADCDTADASQEWEAFEAAEHAVIVYPCGTLEDVKGKARFFLDQLGPNDTLLNCYDSSGPTLDRFLRSLLGEAQP